MATSGILNQMAQTTLLKKISAAATSTNLYVGGADSVTVQCSPQAEDFSGVVAFDVAYLPNLSASNIFPIVTYQMPVWFQAVLLTFSVHTTNLAFAMPLMGAPPGTAFHWIRARIVIASRGAISIYAAY